MAMLPNSLKSPSRFVRRPRSIRRLIFICGAGVLLLLFALLALLWYRAAGSENQELTFGARTLTWEIDSSVQTNLFTHASEKPNPAEGDFETRHQFGLRLPFGTLLVRTHHDPVELITKRLPTNITELTKLLDSREPADVFCAAQELEQRSKEAISALPQLVAAANRSGLFFPAIQEIALVHPQQALPLLIRGLSATNSGVRFGSSEVLGLLGTDAVSAAPALLAAFHAETELPQIFALSLVQVSSDCSATLPRLRTILRNTTNSYHLQSVLMVLQGAGHQAAPALPEVLKLATAPNTASAVHDLRPMALGILARISPDPQIALPPILSALNAPMPDRVLLRPSAIRALGNLGAAGLPHLITIYQGTNQQERVDATQLLARMGPTAAEALDVFIADLNSGTPSRVIPACGILKNMGERAAPALPVLRNLLVVPSRRVRVHAAATLFALGGYSDNMVPVLVEAIGEMSRAWGSDAVTALTTLGQIVRTNSEARITLEQRLRANPKVAVYFKQNCNLFRIYGLPPL